MEGDQREPLLETGQQEHQVDGSPDGKEHYLNYTQYVLALVGFTVGFGSFWRFPYLVYENGGGVFLIPYTIAMVCFGIPLLYLETAVGQMYQMPITKIFENISSALKPLGFFIISVPFIVSAYYNLLLAYSYRYVFTSFIDPLPFATESITDGDYFGKEVLHRSSSIEEFGEVNLPLAAMYILSLYICYECIKRGVKVSGRILIFTVILPYVFITVLMIRGWQLQGSEIGIRYLFQPDWSKLLRPKIWVQALVQVFFQLAVASGGVVSYGSKKHKNEPFLSILYIVPIGLVMCGLLCGLVVFMYVGHFCHTNGVAINDLSLSGLELVFNVFPKAISILPWPNLWFFIFCIILILLGIDSMFGFLELVSQAIQAEGNGHTVKILCFNFPSHKTKLLICVAIALMTPIYCSQAGIYYLQYFDRFLPGIGFSFVAFFQVLLFCRICDLDLITKEVEKSTGQKTPTFIKAILTSRFLLIALGCFLGLSVYQQATLYNEYSVWLYGAGWFLSLYFIVIGLLYWWWKHDGYYHQMFDFQQHESLEMGQIALRQNDEQKK